MKPGLSGVLEKFPVPTIVCGLRSGIAWVRRGLRQTAAQAEARGLASLSNVALLKRVRKRRPWLERLVARQIGVGAQATSDLAAAHGRLVRLVDGTTVAKKERER